MGATNAGRAWGDPMLASLTLLLFVSLAFAAPAAQDPNPRLRNWAAAGQAEAIRELLSKSEQVLVDSTDEAGCFSAVGRFSRVAVSVPIL